MVKLAKSSLGRPFRCSRSTRQLFSITDDWTWARESAHGLNSTCAPRRDGEDMSFEPKAGVSRRSALLTAGLSLAMGGASAGPAKPAPTVTVTIGDEVRAFDARLSGAALEFLPIGAPQLVDGGRVWGQVMAACDVGVWTYSSPERLPAELTKDLLFGDGSRRETYSTDTTKVRRSYKVGEENHWSETTIVPTISTEELKKVISFGGRAIKTIGDRTFYLTSMGLYAVEAGKSTWQMCSARPASTAVSDADPAMRFSPNGSTAPLAVNDIALVQRDVVGGVYLVAADTGLYLLEIGTGFGWTALPAHFGVSFRAIFPADGGADLTFFVATEDNILSIRIDPQKKACSYGGTAIYQNGVPVDLRSQLGPFRQIVWDANKKRVCVLGQRAAILEIDSTLLATKLQLIHTGLHDDLIKTDLGSVPRQGRRAVFLANGGLLIANDTHVLLVDDQLEVTLKIRTDVAGATFPDQLICGVGEPWPDVIAIGSSQGGVQLLSLAWLKAQGAAADISVTSVWSRLAPLLLETKLIVGPMVAVGPGEYVDSADPDCAQDEEKQKAVMKFIADAAVAAGSIAAAQPEIALAALYDAMRQLLTIGGVHDQFSAYIASMFYGYHGKANCIVLPSGPAIHSDVVQAYRPMVIEGTPDGDPSKAQFSRADFGVDAPVGWCKFDLKGDPDSKITVSGQDVFKLSYVRFKNWSHNRTRSVRLDLLVTRNEQAGRKTVIVP